MPWIDYLIIVTTFILFLWKPYLCSGGDQSMVEISEEDQKRLLAEYEEELNKGDESGKHSRRSSGTQMSSSSSGSFAFVTVSNN